jgi:glycosyltransferase involved in cell wall biosynthesis
MRAGRVWVCSEEDKQGFAELTENNVPIDVVPNAIDTAFYDQPDRKHEAEDWSSEPLTMTYLGAYSYYPNEQAAIELIQDVLPLVQSRGIPARLQLIGANPTSAMKAAAADRKDIEITGPVESVLPYLKERCIMVLPLRLGGGTRLKILEAFAASRPVISTAKGAEGIRAIDGTHLLIRETPGEIADAVIALWNDAPSRGRLCAAGLKLVNESYSQQSTNSLIRQSLHEAFAKLSP